MAEFTGKHMLGITCGAFGVIIAVNIFMAYSAVSTFPGVEVANSYVAGQDFNARREAQERLGWTMTNRYEAGRMELAFTDASGRPVQVTGLEVLIGRTTRASEDVTPEFIWHGDRYVATVALPKGIWMIKVRARAEDGTLYEQRQDFEIRG